MSNLKGKLKCKHCGKVDTFPNFVFIGCGKDKKGKPGSYRSDTCLVCHKRKNK